MKAIQDMMEQEGEFPPGYREFPGYPAQFQVVDFPGYGPYTCITGNNQAFFFAKAVTDEQTGAVRIVPNQENLKKLLAAIIAQSPDDPEKCPIFYMQIDADVFENPERFVDNYQSLRKEPDESERRRLLREEIDIIGHFVNGHGLYSLAKSVLKENADRLGQTLSEMQLNNLTTNFMGTNFCLKGVRTNKPLLFATWEVHLNGGGVFMTRQQYLLRTDKLQRPWKMGLGHLLSSLRNNGHPGATEVLEAIDHTRKLGTVDLTWGHPPRGEPGGPKSQYPQPKR